MKAKISALQFIAIGYIATILTGSLLLCLPFAVKDGNAVSFFDALFTSTSATCVTGLVVADTFSRWTLFGQLTILFLIQIGGLGFMTVMTLLFLAFGKKVGIFERTVLLQSAGAFNLSGVIKLIKRILVITLACEFCGAALLSIRFIPKLGAAEGVYFSVFHSISAFCNAGFDLMGKFEPSSSLTLFRGDVLVNLTICALITVGGLGFVVWSDVIENKFGFSKYQLHTKIVIIVNFALIAVGVAVLMTSDSAAAFKDMPFGEKLLAALFQSVSPRTAGFNTVNYSDMSELGALFTTVLMFIGGNPGSTAGGVKTTTIVIVFLNLLATAENKNSVKAFGRSVRTQLVAQANALFLTYIAAILFATGIILAIEPYSLKEILFEVTSALGTVGLSFGITSALSAVSKSILILLMFAGRMGAFSLFAVFFKTNGADKIELPEGKILIG